MGMNRRAFLACTAAAALPQRFRLPSPPAAPLKYPCLVLRVPGECSLPESVTGYCAALPAGSRARRETWIIPAVVDIPSYVTRMLMAALHRGATVLVESGGGVAEHLNFRRHRRALRESLHVDVQAPVALWTDDS